MDPETRQLLEDTFDLSRENNKMLKKMQNAMFWGRIMSVLYYFVIIGSAIGAYYFIEPFIKDIGGFYESISNTAGNVLPDLPEFLSGTKE